MKYIFIISFVIPFGVIYSRLSTVQTNNKILGTWVVYDAEVNSTELDSTTVDYVKDLVKSFHYKFESNGKLFYKDVIIENAEGTWNLTKDILKLKYSFEAPSPGMKIETVEHERTMKVIELTASHMIWYEEQETNDTIKCFLKRQTTSNN